MLPVAKQKAISAGISPREHKHGDKTKNAERLNTRSRRSVGAENDAIKLPERVCSAQSEQRGAFVAVVNDFKTSRRLLAQTRDLFVGQRSVTAIDVADDVGVGSKNDILINQAGSGDRRTAGVNGALNPVFAGPRNHLVGGGAVFHTPEANFAKQRYAGLSQRLEIFFDHAVLNDRCARMDFDAARTESSKSALRGDGHGL